MNKINVNHNKFSFSSTSSSIVFSHLNKLCRSKDVHNNTWMCRFDFSFSMWSLNLCTLVYSLGASVTGCAHFVKKGSHLSRCVMGTLRNIKNVVGNFVTFTDGHKGAFKMWRLCSSMETRLDLKVPENHLQWQQIDNRIALITHNSVSDLTTYVLSS